MNFDGKGILRLLYHYGCSLERIRGSHHILHKNGKTMVIPAFAGELGRGLTHRILKASGLA